VIVSATGCAWFAVGAAVSALSGDTGSAIISAVVAGFYALALRVFYRAHHMI
jgi:hypothetical protein